MTLSLTLLEALGPRTAAKHKKAGHGHDHGHAPAAGAVEKRVAPPARSDAAPTPKRGESIPEVATPGASSPGAEAGAITTTRAAKTKVYTFGAMDVEGKLKTPQLLYFLNRIKLELEMSAPDQRSFMKELERTADDPSL